MRDTFCSLNSPCRRASSLSESPLTLPGPKRGPRYGSQFPSFLTQDPNPWSLARGTRFLMQKESSSRGPQHTSSGPVMPLPRATGPPSWPHSPFSFISTSEGILFIILTIIFIIINNYHSLSTHHAAGPGRYFTPISSIPPHKKPAELDMNLPIDPEGNGARRGSAA